MFSNKPSCIKELKELAKNLTDRDTLMKEDYLLVKSIIHCNKLNNTQKIKKIKTIIEDGTIRE